MDEVSPRVTAIELAQLGERLSSLRLRSPEVLREMERSLVRHGQLVAVVFVQASLVPAAARLLRVRMRRIEPQPWALGVRLQDEPTGVHRLTIKAGSPADGRTVRRKKTKPSC